MQPLSLCLLICSPPTERVEQQPPQAEDPVQGDFKTIQVALDSLRFEFEGGRRNRVLQRQKNHVVYRLLQKRLAAAKEIEAREVKKKEDMIKCVLLEKLLRQAGREVDEEEPEQREEQQQEEREEEQEQHDVHDEEV